MAIRNHDNLINADPTLVLWRYMDLEKFRSFLENQALFFCRADKFSDPFEGSLPRIEYESRNAWAGKDTQAIIDKHKYLKRSFIVNCWHINNNESDAMWRLYLKDNEGRSTDQGWNPLERD
jgi:hypothetical protein